MSIEAGPGRRPSTSRQLLERAALALFAERGFEATTVDEIAMAAGVSRRSFFRYYASKNDVVWGDFDAGLAEMAAGLAVSPDGVGLWAAVTEAVLRFNAIPESAVAGHRQRMSMILHVPALQAHSTLRYADWRGVVSGFVAARLDQTPEELTPRLLGHVALAAALTGYEAWLRDDAAELGRLLAAAFGALDPMLSLDPTLSLTATAVTPRTRSGARHTSPGRRRG